jgi:hypothetical protein
LDLIDPDLLKGLTVVFDEIPQELVRTLLVRYEAKDAGHVWEKFLQLSPSPYQGYEKVSLDPAVSSDEIQRFIDNITSSKDNATGTEVARLLKFLRNNHEVLYQTQSSSNGKQLSVYQAVDWYQLKGIVDSANVLIILSAQLQETLFGFVATHLLKLKIDLRDISDSVKLETMHSHRVRIYPLLAEGEWSSSLKSAVASEVLTDNNHPIVAGSTVSEHMQRVVHSKLGAFEFLLITNTKDQLLPEMEQENVSSITSAAHGINQYRHIHHAAFLSSNRPTPFESRILKMFATDHNLSASDLAEAVITERCYESAYQCIARTSIREAHVQDDFEHIIFVPDMGHADYLVKWFNPGCAVIDKSLSCNLKTCESRAANEQRKLEAIIRILSDKLYRGIKIKDALIREGISRTTFDRDKRKFELELAQRGLI